MLRLRALLDESLGLRYRIERELGSGGMAHVFLATDLKHGRKVALKVLRPELGHELGVERFLREIRIAAGLSHPNILPLFDSGEAGGLLYFVMPFVDGESLRERLRREGALPLDDVVRLVRDVGSGLARAHEHGVVHRDIKPENILLERDRALVADFGVARAVDAAGGPGLTRTGMAVGTPAYMSPEQVEGTAGEDTRSDLYSLACVAYEALAGAPPFTGPSARVIVAAHLARDVPPLRERRPDLPKGVAAVLERALAKDPAERYATATEMVEALGAAVTEEARSAEEGRARRRRLVRAAAVVAAIPVAITGIRWASEALSRPAIERLAVLPASNLTRDPAHDPFVDGVHEALVMELQRAGISIIARQSVLRYRESDLPIRQIAAELGVDALIQPAVAREADSVVVDVGLFDADTELPIWTSSFASDVGGVLGLYRDVSGRIAQEIGAVLSDRASERLAERPAVDPSVLEAVYNGHFHLRRFNPQDFTIALGYFEEALARDSLYAPAHLGVASVWLYRAQAGLLPAGEAAPHVDRHLASAIELDPDDPLARFTEAAQLVWADRDLDRGEPALRAVLELDPNNAETQAFYGHVLLIQGRWDEALERGRMARELDPRNAFATGLSGTILASTGRYREAIELFERMFAANPGTGFGRPAFIQALEAEGRYEEAFAQTMLLPQAQLPGVGEAVEAAYRANGYGAAVRAFADALAAIAEEQFVGPQFIAAQYAEAGDVTAALHWLDVALEQEDQNLPYVGVLPAFHGLHADPRFQRLAATVGVELVRSAR